ncbi:MULTISPECIES: GAF domain-containing sensor histidine kinase [Aerosakkonema]|uniref:GAF domain-containing sensor histidine kinase n=1 Tax=Aerosakkonema TaxID=1246629 RepID=UPI0035B934CB
MIKINFKKVLSRKEILPIINEIVKAIESSLVIEDVEGNILIGVASEKKLGKYPVELSGETIGWVSGSEKAAAVAALISYVVNKELEKKTLANELIERYREITFLYEISQKISATLDLKEVAKLVIHEARELIQATSGSLMLLNTSTGRLEVIAEFNKQSQSKSTLNLGDGIVGNVVMTGRGEIVNDVLSDARFVQSQEQVSSLICVPLKTKDKVIGAIEISSNTPVAYTAADLKLLTMLASQAGAAIENALLHEHQLRESHREALLFRLAGQIRHSLDLDTILETAVSEIRSLLQIDRCQFIWYRPEEEKFIHPNFGDTSRMLNTSDGWEIFKEAKNPDLPSLVGYYSAADIGCFTQQLLNMEMVWADDVRTIADPVMRKFFVDREFVSLFTMPIQTRSGAIGAICCVRSAEVRSWSECEVELLQAVATQLAIALDQAELYHQAATAACDAQTQAQQLQQTLHELQQTQAQLIQSEKMSSLGQLVAGVAHEINNPVNFIYANLSYASQYSQNLLQLVQLYSKYYPEPVPEIQAEMEAIELDFLVEDLPKILSSMHVGVERIRQIVLSLRNFSRLDQAEMKPVNIHEGIDSTLMILHHQLKATAENSAIQVIKEYGDLPLVECYPGQLNQVFMNILSNAIDALEVQRSLRGAPSQSATPCISIRTEALENNRIAIRIRDNGPGMTEEVIKRLFDPFFTTKPVGKGTGLGLSISYQIVLEKHSGILKCFSQPGQGAEFLIEIPMQAIASTRPDRKNQRIVDFPPNSPAYFQQAQCG